MNCVHVLRTYQEALPKVLKKPLDTSPRRKPGPESPKSLDSGFRRNDEKGAGGAFSTPCTQVAFANG